MGNTAEHNAIFIELGINGDYPAERAQHDNCVVISIDLAWGIAWLISLLTDHIRFEMCDS